MNERVEIIFPSGSDNYIEGNGRYWKRFEMSAENIGAVVNLSGCVGESY